MDFFTYRISLDMNESTSQSFLNVRKSDSARKLLFTLSDNGKAYQIGSGCTAVFRAKKPDGTILYNNCSINGNVIEYELTNQTISAEGIVECEVTLYGNDGRQITSPRFNIVVNDTIYADNEVESQNEFTQLTQAILGANNLNIEVERSGEGTVITITKKDGTSEQVIVSKAFFLDVFVITETEVVTNKTYAEIKAAIDAGDIIYITDKNGIVYVPQVAKTSDKIELLWLDSHDDRTYRWSAVVNSENAWSVTFPELATTDELGNLAALKTQAADNLVVAINEVKQTTDTKANSADLAPVATSGSYSDLTNKPTIPSVPTATIEANAAARHTHDNKTLLDSITEALKTAWNTASEWVSTNGANVLSHLSDGVKHITANERSAWNGKQDKLIAGDNITIAADGKTISATGGGGGGSTVELDTTLSKAGKAADAKAVGDALAGKQDTINDLEAIRAGAAKGATALQAVPSTYRTATAQDAIDNGLSNRINAIEGKEAGWNSKYVKPTNGIPKTDLANDVQASLGKADTALQSVPSTYRTASEQDTIDSGKVDKVTGKGLSTNDYTDAAKAKVDALAPVATSGNYNDLSNKPTIPAPVTEQTVSGWGFTKNTGTYSKPTGGIPKTDLANAVQASLGKADTALQEHQSLADYRTALAQDVIDSDLSDRIEVIEGKEAGWNGKQDKLIAGDNITIAADGKTISAIVDGTSVAMRVNGGYIQYSTDNGNTWSNLIAKADLKGDKGDTGPQGLQGPSGISPTITIDETASGAMIDVTNADGSSYSAYVLHGQSAYDAAKTGGYTDTQANFYTDLAAMQGLASALAAI